MEMADHRGRGDSYYSPKSPRSPKHYVPNIYSKTIPLDVGEHYHEDQEFEPLVKNEEGCWEKFWDFFADYNMFNYDGVMNVYYDKDNECNSVVTWKSKTACCLMFVFFIVCIYIFYYNAVLLGELDSRQTMGFDSLPDPAIEDYGVGDEYMDDAHLSSLPSDYDLGEMQQDLGFLVWFNANQAKRVCDDFNSPTSKQSFTYNSFYPFSDNLTFSLKCEFWEDNGKINIPTGYTLLVFRFKPPTGIPLTYIVGKKGRFEMNMDAALWKNQPDELLTPAWTVFDLATGRLNSYI